VPVSSHKTEGPACIITSLDIEIDVIAGELRLPQDKLRRLVEQLASWHGKKSTTRKELEVLIGHLCHAAIVVHLGRIFLRELFALLHVAKLPHLLWW